MNTIIKSKKTYFILGILFIFLLWIIGSAFVKNDYVLPSVKLTSNALINLLSQVKTYKILGLSLLRLMLCVLISLILALLCALLAIRFDKVEAFLKPQIGLIKTLPVAVLIILLLVLFSSKIAVYVITCFVMFPLIYEGILLGFKSIDKEILEDIRTVSKFNYMVAKKIYIPLSFPFILTALIQSFGLGLKVSVMAEFLAQPNNSIGQELMFYKNYTYEMEYVLAWSIILVVIVLVIEIFIKLINDKLLEA